MGGLEKILRRIALNQVPVGQGIEGLGRFGARKQKDQGQDREEQQGGSHSEKDGSFLALPAVLPAAQGSVRHVRCS